MTITMRDVREIKQEYKDGGYYLDNGHVYFAADLCEIIERQQAALKWYAETKYSGCGTEWVPKGMIVGQGVDSGMQRRASEALLEDE